MHKFYLAEFKSERKKPIHVVWSEIVFERRGL